MQVLARAYSLKILMFKLHAGRPPLAPHGTVVPPRVTAAPPRATAPAQPKSLASTFGSSSAPPKPGRAPEEFMKPSSPRGPAVYFCQHSYSLRKLAGPPPQVLRSKSAAVEASKAPTWRKKARGRERSVEQSK